VKVALNEPRLFEVTVVGDVACGAPSYVIVIFLEAAKPCPDTVTIVPAGPLVGEMVIDGVTVKLVEAELLLASVAVTV
jgi:hypothetical protein